MEQLINNLHKLIDKKIELLEDIMKVTNQQKLDIEQNEADNLEPLIDQKQQIINRIDEIDKAFGQLSTVLKKNLGIASFEEADARRYPTLAALKGKVKLVMTLASSIMEVEKQNMDKLNIIFSEVKAELKKLNSGKKSLKAYEPQSYNVDGIFIDRKK